MIATNIRWDTDGEEINLPLEIEIPEGMTDVDKISDYISDVTGFCHYGFDIDGEFRNRIFDAKKEIPEYLLPLVEAQIIEDLKNWN